MDTLQNKQQTETSNGHAVHNGLAEVVSRTNEEQIRKLVPKGIVLCTFLGFNTDQSPLVSVDLEAENEIIAQTIVALNKFQIGSRAVVNFSDDPESEPIILGLLQEASTAESIRDNIAEDSEKFQSDRVRCEMDGERILLSAEKEIVLKCGKASITLTKAGKILIRGAYVLNRSSGVNRIKGGVVHIN